MLKIKELSVSKELDRKAMAGVAGGMTILPGLPGLGGFTFNLASPINAPKVAEIGGVASSFTGPVTAATGQDDRDVINNVGYGQVVNTGGNVAHTDQWVTSAAANTISNMQ